MEAYEMTYDVEVPCGNCNNNLKTPIFVKSGELVSKKEFPRTVEVVCPNCRHHWKMDVRWEIYYVTNIRPADEN